jgi:hypothetical protein
MNPSLLCRRVPPLQMIAVSLRGRPLPALPIALLWFEEFPTREEAKAAEVQLKKWSRRKKEALVEGQD